MADKMKIRAGLKKEGYVEVKALMSHPMETGNRKDKKTGDTIPAHFIEEVTATYKDKTVFSAMFSGGVSVNPYISFRFTGAAKGDKISMSWVDNKGGSNQSETVIK